MNVALAGKKTALILEPDRSMGFMMTVVLKRHGFTVITCETLQEILTKVRGAQVKMMIIAEEVKAGPKTGFDIISAFNKTYQGSIPILVTCATPTEEKVILSIRAGALEFLVKPTSEQVLMRKIEAAMSRGSRDIVVSNVKNLNFKPGMTIAEMIDMVINEADEIRAMPHAVAKITQVSQDEKSGAQAMEQAINSDPAIAAMTLKRANSAFYKGQSQITSVKQAVVRIGFNECRKMVLGFSVFKLFAADQKCFGFNRLHFWVHSVATGIIAEYLSKKTKAPQADDAFLAGLLHDFGKLLFDDYLSGHFQKALQLANINNISLYDSETKVFERTHNAVSKAVMEKWNFATHIADAVLRHHTPPKADKEGALKPGLAESLYLANQMAKASLIGFGGDSIGGHIPDALWKAYGFAEGEFKDEEIALIYKGVREFLEFLGVTEKEIGRAMVPPKSAEHILVVRNADEDHRILSFFLRCQGHKVTCLKSLVDLPPEAGFTKILVFVSDKEGASEAVKGLSKGPPIPSALLTGKFKYAGSQLPKNIKVIEGNVDFQTLKLAIK